MKFIDNRLMQATGFLVNRCRSLLTVLAILLSACNGSDSNNNDNNDIVINPTPDVEPLPTTFVEPTPDPVDPLDDIIRDNPLFVENLRLSQVNLAYSHNSYDSRADRWPETNLEMQLDAGVRVLEFDIWDSTGLIAHDDATVAQHCESISNCLTVLMDWSSENSGHAPIVIQFEITDNGEFVEVNELDEQALMQRTQIIQEKIALLAQQLKPLVDSNKLISYQESLNSVADLRDKFLVTLYRKYNTPFFQPRSNFSKRQTLPISTALMLTAESDEGQAYRELLISHRIFLGSRYIGDESPDGWDFADPDYLGQIRLEKEARLENQMLRVLKQDGSAYRAEGFTENTFMVSNVVLTNQNASMGSYANGIGTHKLRNLEGDRVVAETLNYEMVPHCVRSNRDVTLLDYCQLETFSANAFDTETTLKIAIIPDTQGRDDDWGRNTVTLPDGTRTHSGMDYNRDGYYDGEGYLIDVSNPWNPQVVLDEGEIIRVAQEDQQDYPFDFKHLPFPLVRPTVQRIIDEGADIALAIGDLTDLRSEIEYVEWVDTVGRPLEEAGIPVFPIRGNHEIVDGRDWTAWFTSSDEISRRKGSVNNVDNDFNAYAGHPADQYDQGYKLYSAYGGAFIQEKIDQGRVVGYPGIEDLMYYFVEDNVLIIAIDVYASELVSTQYRGTWSTFFPWIKDVVNQHRGQVDHIIAFAHEAFSTKKRPQLYNRSEYEAYLASEAEGGEEPTPGVLGSDISQLGKLEEQSESVPGLDEELLSFFAANDILYIAGHDHQYSRSAIHSVKGDKTSDYFIQIVGGNLSWKSFNNRYGENAYYETQFAQDSHTNPNTEKNTKLSFVMVEIADRKMTTTHWYANHDLSEDDMTRGAYWKAEENQWFKPVLDEETSTVAFQETPVVWIKGDSTHYTSDATQRIVSPIENYWTTSSTPIDQGYLGTEASILEGFNLTYNSSEVFRADASDFVDSVGEGRGEYLRSIPENADIARRIDHLSELLSLSWMRDENPQTYSDILLIDGIRSQDGTYDNTVGNVQPTSTSEMFYDKDGRARVNPTMVIRDGEITDADQADAIAIAISAPDTIDLSLLTIGRYNPENGRWEPVLEEQCRTITGYSDDFSVMHNDGNGNQGHHPDGATVEGCNLKYWGYNYNSRSVWGFIHTDGYFALIPKD